MEEKKKPQAVTVHFFTYKNSTTKVPVCSPEYATVADMFKHIQAYVEKHPCTTFTFQTRVKYV